MTEQVEQWICIKFCVKLEHSSVESIWMVQKAIAMSNWWLAASSWQRVHSCIISQTGYFWWNIKSPGWLSDPPPPIWHPATFGFYQNQNYLSKGRDFRPLMRFRKIQWGCWWQLGEGYEAPRCLLWRGTEALLSCVQCFLCLVSSSKNVSIFHITWLDTFWTDLIYCEL